MGQDERDGALVVRDRAKPARVRPVEVLTSTTAEPVLEPETVEAPLLDLLEEAGAGDAGVAAMTSPRMTSEQRISPRWPNGMVVRVRPLWFAGFFTS